MPSGPVLAPWVWAIVGIVLFSEPRDVARLFFIFLIIAGIVGLKLATPG